MIYHALISVQIEADSEVEAQEQAASLKQEICDASFCPCANVLHVSPTLIISTGTGKEARGCAMCLDASPRLMKRIRECVY